MKLISDSTKLDKKIVSLIKQYNKIYIATAWATLGTNASNMLFKNSKKIEKMIVGITGFSTSPEFIEKYKDIQNIKYMLNSKGTFHPKIYLFYSSKKEWECLIGSANFTKSGMSVNTELMIHVTSNENETHTFINNLFQEINKYFSLGYRMTDDKYQTYLQAYNKNKGNKKNIETSNREVESQMSEIPINKLSWKKYFEKTKNSIEDSLDERLELLSYVDEYFEKYKSLKNMPDNIVKQIAGIVSEGDHNINWMYFGNMVSPHFKSHIIESQQYYSDALDLIPLSGVISKDMYMNFINLVEKHLPSGYGAGVITLSRLLAMKRPDIFYCITSNNEYPLYRDFNVKPLGTKEFERYWDDIIVNIHKTEWYKSNEPSDEIEKKVWKVRAAMLDIITY